MVSDRRGTEMNPDAHVGGGSLTSKWGCTEEVAKEEDIRFMPAGPELGGAGRGLPFFSRGPGCEDVGAPFLAFLFFAASCAPSGMMEPSADGYGKVRWRKDLPRSSPLIGGTGREQHAGEMLNRKNGLDKGRSTRPTGR